MSQQKLWEIQLAADLQLSGLGKLGALEKQNFPPGQPGKARKPRTAQFSSLLSQKQKLIFHNGIREEQLRRFARKAKSMPLEPPLDKVLFRSGFAQSMEVADWVIESVKAAQ